MIGFASLAAASGANKGGRGMRTGVAVALVVVALYAVPALAAATIPDDGTGGAPDQVSGRCDVKLCEQLGVKEPAWVQLTPRSGEDVTLCSCNFDSIRCDPANLSTDPRFPPCVPPGDTLGATPTATIFWSNSGTCTTKTVKIGGQWVCLTPKK